MSVIPEFVLHKAIVRGFAMIRKDPRIMDALFKQVDQAQLSQMKAFIQSNSIAMHFNYPRQENPAVPAIIVQLTSETEAQALLGDGMGEYPRYGVPDQELTIDTLGGHATSVSTLEGLPTAFYQGLEVTSSRIENDVQQIFLNSADDRLADFYALLMEGQPPCLKVHVVSGTGAGQTAILTRITNNRLDTASTFRAQLDSSSLLDLRLARDPERAVGEPSRVYEPASNLARRGFNFETNYQLAILASNQNEVLYLYSIIKALLIMQRMFMESQGIMALKIAGSDLSPRTEYGPDEVFQRVMTVSFTYPFSFIEVRDDVFESISVELFPTDPSDDTAYVIDLNITL